MATLSTQDLRLLWYNFNEETNLFCRPRQNHSRAKCWVEKRTNIARMEAVFLFAWICAFSLVSQPGFAGTRLILEVNPGADIISGTSSLSEGVFQLRSSVYRSFGLNGSVRLGKKVNFNFVGKLRQAQYERPETAELDNISGNLSEAGLGFGFRFGPVIELGIMGKRLGLPGIRSASNSRIVLKAMNAYAASGYFSIQFFPRSKSHLFLVGRVEPLIAIDPADFQSGLGTGLDLILEVPFARAGIFLNNASFKADDIQYTNTEVGAHLGIVLRFGKDQP